MKWNMEHWVGIANKNNGLFNVSWWGDWGNMVPGPYKFHTPEYPQFFYIQALDISAKFATRLGFADDATRYSGLAKTAREVYVSTFYNATTHCYAGCTYVSQVFALSLGLQTLGLRCFGLFWRYLCSINHLCCGRHARGRPSVGACHGLVGPQGEPRHPRTLWRGHCLAQVRVALDGLLQRDCADAQDASAIGPAPGIRVCPAHFVFFRFASSQVLWLTCWLAFASLTRRFCCFREVLGADQSRHNIVGRILHDQY